MIDEGSSAYIDNELVRRTRAGDTSAFEQLFARHQGRIYAIALQMLGSEPDAADMTQDIFVRAYRSLASLRSDAAFVVWLKTLAINMCRDALRKRARGRTVSLDNPVESSEGDTAQREVEDWSANPEAALGRKERSEAVRRAISSLSPDYREVVALFYVDGAAVAEIARALGAPEGTIKSKLARARAELKRKLAHLVER